MTRYQARHTGGRKRGGFTLVELLMVVVIIGILVAMVATVVLRLTGVGTQVQTTSEIRQLAIGVENFKLKYGVYPPSHIILPPTADTSFSQPYISAIWPRVNFASCSWGNASGDTVRLQGDQCLVYFLRGPSGDGWSTNPSNPTAAKASASETRGGPFFNFAPERLMNRTWSTTATYSKYDVVSYSSKNWISVLDGNLGSEPKTASPDWTETANGFVSYADPNATPANRNYYAFFSSHRTPNGYVTSDCASLGVAPYSQRGVTPTRYYNMNSFQIISAGANFLFGPGGGWYPQSADSNFSSYSTDTANGYDDLANFTPDKLGIPP